MPGSKWERMDLEQLDPLDLPDAPAPAADPSPAVPMAPSGSAGLPVAVAPPRSLMNVDWKGLVKTVAPAIAAAFGGPLAGMATRALGELFLGNPNATEDEIAAAVATAKPEDLLRLRQADIDFRKHLTDAGIKLEEIAAADRASARQMAIQTGDLTTPRVLAVVVMIGFFSSVLAVFAGVADLTEPSTATLVGAVVGYASAKADQVVSYWFGSSSGSKAKTDALERVATK